MKDTIIDILGSYNPRVDDLGNTLTGLASLDFEWIISAFAFLISVWFFFKIISQLFAAFNKNGC